MNFCFCPAMKTQDRLSAVDLRGATDEQLTALKREAIRRKVSFSELLGQIAAEAAAAMLKNSERPRAHA